MRFLFVVWPFTGCVNPNVAVARILAGNGHEVGFHTGRQYAGLLAGFGFEYFPFNRLDESLIDRLVHSQDSIGVNWERPWKLRPQIRELFLGTVPLQMADLEPILHDWNPDVIITDPAMWAPFLLLADLYPIPVAVLSYACGCMLPGPGIPPAGLGLPLPRSRKQRILNWVTEFAQDVFLSAVRSHAGKLRVERGLSRFNGPVISLVSRLPLYLLPSCREFDYNRMDLPESVQYVGPLQWYPETAAPAWLNDLGRSRPLIHATEGTLHVRDPFVLRTTAIALGGLPVDVVLTSGDRDPAEVDLGRPLASNVRLEQWVNHDALLERCSVMVTTAGGGTVAAGLGAGVPMVVIPTEWDKAENAQRVVEAGIGIRIAPGRCTPRRLGEAVKTILRDASYRANAKRLSEIVRRQGGPKRAASLLEQLASQEKGRASSVGT